MTIRPLAVLHAPVQLVSEMNMRENRFVRAKRISEQKAVVRMVLDAWSLRPPPAPLVVRITRLIGCKGRAMDSDNVVTSAKAVRDAIAAWLGIDDRHDHLVRYEVDQVRAANGTPGVRIVLWARAAAAPDPGRPPKRAPKRAGLGRRRDSGAGSDDPLSVPRPRQGEA